MYERPTTAELLDAVRQHLSESVLPLIHDDRRLYYQTLIAINVLEIVEREAQFEVEHLRQEWERLNYVLQTTPPLPTSLLEARTALAERNRALCDAIAAGRYDAPTLRAALFEHLLATAWTQLEVANPKFLQALALEDQQPT
jgi:hypothetical protein